MKNFVLMFHQSTYDKQQNRIDIDIHSKYCTPSFNNALANGEYPKHVDLRSAHTGDHKTFYFKKATLNIISDIGISDRYLYKLQYYNSDLGVTLFIHYEKT